MERILVGGRWSANIGFANRLEKLKEVNVKNSKKGGNVACEKT